MNLGTGAALGKERAKRPRGELSAPPPAPWLPSARKEEEDRKGEGKKNKTRAKLYHMIPHPATKQQVRRKGEEKARAGRWSQVTALPGTCPMPTSFPLQAAEPPTPFSTHVLKNVQGQILSNQILLSYGSAPDSSFSSNKPS